MGYQNRTTITVDIPAANDTDLSADRFVVHHATKGLAYAAENGDADGILVDPVKASTACTVTILALDGRSVLEVEPVDSVAFAVADSVAVGADGKAKESVAGTSIELGKVKRARAANAGTVLEFFSTKKGAVA